MQGECGTHFAKKLECMFQDIMISSEANEHFEEYLQSSAACIPFALTVNVRRVFCCYGISLGCVLCLNPSAFQVLNSMHWPIKMRKAVPIKPVDLFVRAQETYEQFYRTRAANKKLQWDYFHVSLVAFLLVLGDCKLHTKNHYRFLSL